MVELPVGHDTLEGTAETPTVPVRVVVGASTEQVPVNLRLPNSGIGSHTLSEISLGPEAVGHLGGVKISVLEAGQVTINRYGTR